MSMLSVVRSGILAAAACAVTLTAACAEEKEEVTIGLASPSFATAGLRIAQELGIFGEHGLDARFIVMEGSSSAMAGLISKSFNLATLGLPELFVAQARGQDVVAIASTYDGFATSLVLSKTVADELGVSPTAPLDERLKVIDGRLIATPTATAGGTISFQAAMAAAGASERLTYMAQTAMQAALETGSIDGYLSSAPYWALPVVSGKGVLWISGPQGEFPKATTQSITALLVTRAAFAEANPELMDKLRAIVADVGEAVENRPDEVKAAVARLYPDLAPESLDILLAGEARSWSTAPLTAETLANEVPVVKSLGIPLPGIDDIDPATMIAP
jgi:ABC-type nitrate/sulfonate/bicarbonate transport system substrate-binding protein